MTVLESSLIKPMINQKIKSRCGNRGRNSGGGRLGVEIAVGTVSRRAGARSWRGFGVMRLRLRVKVTVLHKLMFFLCGEVGAGLRDWSDGGCVM